MSLEKRILAYTPFMQRFGIRQGMKLAKNLYPKVVKNEDLELKVPDLKHPVHLRMSTTDRNNFMENFIHREFDLPKGIEPKLIVDAGANAGYAALLFLNNYPNADVIAVEPDGSNCDMIRKNCTPYKGFKGVLESAIWKSESHLKVVNATGGKTGFRVEEAESTESGAFVATTIDKILADSGHDRIGLLKIDIEGTEKEIFQGNHEKWLPKTDVLIIELHDRFKPGCALTFYKAIEESGMTQFSNGENLVYIRE